jgi:hypothetical protein
MERSLSDLVSSMRTLVLLAAVLVGCQELPVVPEATCGNAVVDPDEDCDTFGQGGAGCGAPDDLLRSCQLTCGEDAGTCPEGHGCSDGVCLHAIPAFTATARFPTGATEGLLFGDVDGIGRKDLVGIDGTTVTAWFGLGVETRVATEFPTAPVAFGDTNDDQRVDVILPVATGLFTLEGRSGGTLEPVSYPATQAASSSELLIPLVGLFTDGTYLLHVRPGEVALWDPVTETDGPSLVVSSLGGIPQKVPRAPLTAGLGDGPEGVALAAVGDTQVTIVSVEPDSNMLPSPVIFSVVDLPGAVTGPVLFADFDGDQDRDLIIPVEHDVAVSLNNAGLFADAMPAPFFDGMIDAGCGSSRAPLAAGDLNHDGIADYVGDTGICMSWGVLTWVGSRSTPSLWTEVVLADFNRDGELDLAASSEERADLDFFLGDGSGLFNHARVHTSAAPHLMRAGDFNGDFVTDLALVERFDDESEGVSVLYGTTTGAPAPATSMGAMRHVDFLEPARLLFAPNPFDLTHDLIVGSSGGLGPPTWTFLVGSSQRRMLALLPILGTDGSVHQPQGVVVGNLNGDGKHDIAVLTQHFRELVPRIWLLPGNPATGRPDPTLLRDAEVEDVFPPCARMAVVRDKVFIVDATDRCFGYGNSPQSNMVTVGFDDQPRVLGQGFLSGTLKVPRQLQALDVDEDGELDLVISFAGEDKVGTTDELGHVVGAGVAIYWSRDGEIELKSSTELVDFGSFLFGGGAGIPEVQAAAVPFGVTLLNVDAEPDRELLVLTSSGLFYGKRVGRAFGPMSQITYEGISESRGLFSEELDGRLPRLIVDIGGGEVQEWTVEGTNIWRSSHGAIDPLPGIMTRRR